jgi:hypothetical protein
MVHGTGRRLFPALLLLMALVIAGTSDAQAQAPSLHVTFHNCTEFVGIGPVSLTEAQALVPPAFSIVNAGGSALIAVRISNCQGVGVSGSPSVPGTIAHIGINIVPPDGMGDINNYTIIYASNVGALVNALRATGLPAQHDADLLYEFTHDSNATGNLLGIATPDPGPTWHVYGRDSDPAPNSAFPFRAIWWSFQTPGASVLTRLIGGHTIASFPGLSARGVFDNAQMTVTMSR